MSVQKPELTNTHLSIIFGFLDYEELWSCTGACKKWRSAAFKVIKLTKSLEISTMNEFSRYQTVGEFPKLRELKLRNYDHFDSDGIESILQTKMESLSKLELADQDADEPMITKYFQKIVKSYPNLEAFVYAGSAISEEDIKTLAKLTNLKELSFKDDLFLEGVYLSQIPALCVLHSYGHMVRLGNIQGLLTKSAQILTELTLDIDEFSEDEISQLIELLKPMNLRYLSLIYCTNMNDEHLKAINQPDLQYFNLRKTFNVTEEAYEQFFLKRFQSLEILRLPMNNRLDNLGIINISKNCPNLKKLEIIWCEEVDDSGFYEILANCPQLENLQIAGMKKLSEKGFPVFKEFYSLYDQPKIDYTDKKAIENLKEQLIWTRASCKHLPKDFSFYKNLKVINGEKCDFIPDHIYFFLLILNPEIQANNYYNEEMHLPSHKGEQIVYN